MILLDTDHMSVLTDHRHPLREKLLTRLGATTETPFACIVTVEEQLRAWLAEIHRRQDPNRQIVPYLRLRKFLDFLRAWNIVDWNEPAADVFRRLRAARIRVGTQDLKIASIALANDALLLSANLRDFERIPDLRVEDWLYG
jgi:tRNA(fMet)-specific endonuclease VapC